MLGASTYCMNFLKPSCPGSAQSIPGPCQGILENGAASIDGVCRFLRSVKSVVINLVIHGCPVSQVWLLLSASSFSSGLGVIAPTPPTASQYRLVSWQLFYVLRFIVNLSDLFLESELLRRKACIPQSQTPPVYLWERLLKSIL